MCMISRLGRYYLVCQRDLITEMIHPRGNLRQPKKKGGSKKEAKKSNKKSGEEIPKVKLCKVDLINRLFLSLLSLNVNNQQNCHELPRAGDFKYCSTKCAKEAEESDSDHD